MLVRNPMRVTRAWARRSLERNCPRTRCMSTITTNRAIILSFLRFLSTKAEEPAKVYLLGRSRIKCRLEIQMPMRSTATSCRLAKYNKLHTQCHRDGLTSETQGKATKNREESKPFNRLPTPWSSSITPTPFQCQSSPSPKKHKPRTIKEQ